VVEDRLHLQLLPVGYRLRFSRAIDAPRRGTPPALSPLPQSRQSRGANERGSDGLE
jgi:hypothetical protein